MKEIQIPFNEWSKKRLREGEKTATTRTKRYGYPGDTFEVDGTIYVLTHVVKLPLKVVCSGFYEEEGASDQIEFKQIWEDIHYRKGFEPTWRVWLHLFVKREEIVGG